MSHRQEKLQTTTKPQGIIYPFQPQQLSFTTATVFLRLQQELLIRDSLICNSAVMLYGGPNLTSWGMTKSREKCAKTFRK